jgi:hypothetical protein
VLVKTRHNASVQIITTADWESLGNTAASARARATATVDRIRARRSVQEEVRLLADHDAFFLRLERLEARAAGRPPAIDCE